MMTENFDHIRPYNDDEVPAAVKRIANNESFSLISKYLFPQHSVDEIRKLCLQVQTVDDFQGMLMWPILNSIMEKTTAGVSAHNFDTVDESRHYIYICNHRDILLDAALADYFLYANKKGAFEITFGSNLMQGELVIDIGKCNRMFRLVRGGNSRDFYKNSLEVSSYMRSVVLEKQRSVWIAQRNGRTKNGDDKTEMAVLKMFSLSSDKPFVENLGELNICPLVISYEYEPCDFKKTQEVFISRYQRYEKTPNEDMNSILHGVMQQKGGIDLVIAPPISKDELVFCDRFEKNQKFQKLADIIDQRVYENYKLWPNNYIAYDILYQSCKYVGKYTEQQKNDFVAYMNGGISQLIGDAEELREIFLGIYANPVRNYEQLFR